MILSCSAGVSWRNAIDATILWPAGPQPKTLAGRARTRSNARATNLFKLARMRPSFENCLKKLHGSGPPDRFERTNCTARFPLGKVLHIFASGITFPRLVSIYSRFGFTSVKNATFSDALPTGPRHSRISTQNSPTTSRQHRATLIERDATAMGLHLGLKKVRTDVRSARVCTYRTATKGLRRDAVPSPESACSGRKELDPNLSRNVLPWSWRWGQNLPKTRDQSHPPDSSGWWGRPGSIHEGFGVLAAR